jgi:hypothetical protein
VDSRFFTNGNLYGYFINDIPAQEVIDVANAFILPTAYYVQNTLLSKIQPLCTDGLTSLTQVTTNSLGVDLNGLYVSLQGTTDNGSATCKIFIDPSQAAGGQKISYVSNTAATGSTVTPPSTTTTPLTTPTPTQTTTTLPVDSSVKQFPINLDKSMTFSSNRGYSIVFPSSNISYEAINVDDDL